MGKRTWRQLVIDDGKRLRLRGTARMHGQALNVQLGQVAAFMQHPRHQQIWLREIPMTSPPLCKATSSDRFTDSNIDAAAASIDPMLLVDSSGLSRSVATICANVVLLTLRDANKPRNACASSAPSAASARLLLLIAVGIRRQQTVAAATNRNVQNIILGQNCYIEHYKASFAGIRQTMKTIKRVSLG